jgi:hypothetical protein
VNWFWTIIGRDGGMNGLEFCRSLTAGDLRRVLVHAAPAQASIEVRADDDTLIAKGDIDRDGDYSPITLVDVSGPAPARSEIWPTDDHIGMPVLLPGGEVGVLTAWRHDADHEWWQWSVEFSNHKGRPADWEPSESRLRRS